MVKLDPNKGYIDILGEDSSIPSWAQKARYKQVKSGVVCYFDARRQHLAPPDDDAKAAEQARLADRPAVDESALDEESDDLFDTKPSEDGLSADEVAVERKDAEHLGPAGVQMTKDEIIARAYDAETDQELKMLAADSNIKVDGRLKNPDSIRDAIVKAAQDLP